MSPTFIPKLPYILVVDDHELDLELNLLSLKQSGVRAEFRCFRTGHEALDFIRMALSEGCPPRLMVLDLKMPEIDGFDVLQLMQEGGMKQFPVVIMSGSCLPEDTHRVQELGADACYEKPMSLRESHRLFRKIVDTYMKVPVQA